MVRNLRLASTRRLGFRISSRCSSSSYSGRSNSSRSRISKGRLVIVTYLYSVVSLLRMFKVRGKPTSKTPKSCLMVSAMNATLDRLARHVVHV